MSNPLIVPMALDVLMAPQALLARDKFRWWKFGYSALNDSAFQSPEPIGFSSQYDTIKPGTYLHWTLPRSLRSSSESSSTSFPLVPNRWLIVRIYRDAGGNNVQRAWVLESDCPVKQIHNSSFFLVTNDVVQNWKNSSDPNRNSVTPTKISTRADTGVYTADIGLPVDLSAWHEQSPNNMFLTAVAPGNIEFSGYVPFNMGIFSFYDDLSNVPTTTTLSYLVTGWYADPSCDILTTGSNGFTGGTTVTDVLNSLSWTIAQNQPAGSADMTLYNGMAFGLPWNGDATAAPDHDELEDLRNSRNVTVAIGNTGVDAFTTLVATQLQNLPGYTDTDKVIELLRAFQYDLLPALNNINGDAVVAERVRQEWFNSRTGGTRWKIVAKQDASNGSTGAAISAHDAAWLLQLNTDQKALDDAIELLYSLQWDLNAAWWKEGFLLTPAVQYGANHTGITDKDLAPFLDPANSNGLLYKVLQQLKVVDDLAAKVPQPVYSANTNAQDAYQAGIAVFAQQKGISSGFELKAVAAPRFWKPDNPSVLVSGIQPDPITDPESGLEIRLPSQLIPSFTVNGTTISGDAMGSIIPELPNTGVLPGGITNVYQEFFLLDPANAQQIASKFGLDANTVLSAMTAHSTTNYINGILPASSLNLWSQKWNPLYLEWEVIHMDAPYEWIANPPGDAVKNWTFNGTDYDLKPAPQGTAISATLSGRSLLSPHTQFTFGAKLKAFIDQYGSEAGDLSGIYDEIKNIDNWRFLTQELVNFNEYLTQRDARAYRRPTTESFIVDQQTLRFAKVIGYPDSTTQPPYDTPSYAQGYVNSIPSVKAAGPSSFPFHGIRSGQFYFNNLIVFDKFGRKLDLIVPDSGGIDDAAHFPLVRDKALSVNNNLVPQIQAPFQLPPRLLQHAKLDLLLIDYRSDANAMGLSADVNPICGWVICNHLDHSILVFLPDGTNAGELLQLQNGVNKTVGWIAPPHNNINSISDITAISKQLGAFVNTLNGRPSADFEALLGAIDSTLWTTDPLGNRTDLNFSALVGRPLALVRTKLQFLLGEIPLQSCDWPSPVRPAATNPNIPAFTSSTFSIRLGDQATREDGVIGYFEADNYNLFNSVAAPNNGQQYVQQIGPIGGADGNYINLPFDGNTSRLITLLVDPRGSVHATTGILPVKEMVLPAQYVDKPLAALEVTFRIGPLLSRILPASTADNAAPPFPDTINYGPIAEKKGTWSWWQNTITNPGTANAVNNWQGYSLVNAPTLAVLDKAPASVHEGYLQFITDAEPGNQQ